MAAITPFGENNFGVRTVPINFDAPGAPTAMTYHGLSIVINGKLIGRIQSFSPQMFTREGAWVYELSNLTWGRPVDYVPGKNSGYTVSATRLEVWNAEWEIALGYNFVWTDLMDQNKPFEVSEYLFRGSTVYRSFSYLGCWMQNRNNSAFEAEGDAKITATAEFAFVTRHLTSKAA